MKFLLAALLVAIVMVPAARGLWIDLPSGTTKCIMEEISNKVVVLADYYSFFGDQYDENATVAVPSISVKVTSPYGNELHKKEKESHGQFAFTSSEAGTYQACFTADEHSGKSVTIGLEWKTGIATKDYESVAKKEKIDGLELELQKLGDYVADIHEKLINLINKEAEMRQVSEDTNGRVAMYSIMSLGVCVFVSSLQIWYLRQYFQKKKLI